MLKIEFKKLKLFSLLSTVLIIPLLANIFGTINYLLNQEILKTNGKVFGRKHPYSTLCFYNSTYIDNSFKSLVS